MVYDISFNICNSRSTSVHSALGGFAIMRYTNLLLTLTLT